MTPTIADDNCTIHFDGVQLRGRLYRVLDPDNLRFVAVELSASALKYYDGVSATDGNGKFRGITPTKLIEPDQGVTSINWLYCIGDSVDACPFSIDMFGWYDNDNNN